MAPVDPRAALATAKARLVEMHRDIGESLAEVARLIESGVASLGSDRVEAKRLISSAADLEFETLGDCEAVGALMDSLGIVEEEP